MDWFRSHHGAPLDAKHVTIAKRSETKPGVSAAIWWSLMDYASQQEDRGSVEGYDTEVIANFFDWPVDMVNRVVQVMRDMKLVSDDRLTSWEKRQPDKEDYSTPRVQKHRERKKEEMKRPETPGNVEQNREEQNRAEEIRTEEELKAIAEPDGSTAVVPINSKAIVKHEPRTADVIVTQLTGILAEVQESTDRRLSADELRKAQSGLVFAYWSKKLNHPKAILDLERERLLIKRLKENRGDVNELLYCVDGALRDPWIMGTAPKSEKKYDGIENIFRERSQVEKLAGNIPAYKEGKPHAMAVKYMGLSNDPSKGAA